MPMRKRVNKDAAGTQPTTGEREDEVSDDSEVEFLSLSHATTSRPKRKREAKSKVAPKELTEEEMFDLAVRLSEQEASDAALRRQREEDEALQRAIEESMSQTQPLPPSRSPSPLLDIVPGRRRLEFCSDDPGPSARLEVTSKRSHPELDHKGPGDTNNNSRTKRKRNDEDSSPLPEMPDLSQTQKIFTQTSPFPSSSQLSEPPTTQDLDCTQHPSSSQLPPPEALRPSLVCTRMSQELLATCQSGSVSCSQENLMSRPKTPTFTKGLSLTADPTLSQSPTFPRSPVFSGRQREQDSRSSTTSPIFGRTSQNLRPPPTPMLPESPALSKNVVPAKTSPSPTFLGSQGISKNPCLSESLLFDKSDIFSAADLDDGVDTQPLSQDYSNTSPVFGKVSQKNKKPSLVCKPNQSLSNTSPTFPRNTDNLTESSRPLPKTLLLSESDPEDDVLVEQDHATTSPVFGRPSLNQRPSLACKPNLSGSPTFPRDPAVSKKYPNIPNTPTFSRSPRTPILSETNSEEEEAKVQGINTTSPVFGRASQGLRPSLACKPNISLSRSPTVPRSQTDSESQISSKSPTFPKSPTIPNSPLFSDSERDSEWTSWKSRISLSPVFPAERSLLRPNIHSFSPNYKSLGPRHRIRRDVESGSPGPSSPRASNRLHWLPGRSDSQGAVAPQPQNEPRPGPSQGLARRPPAHTLEAGGGVMVCYCWGVPFCPPGSDPDNYTEVIVDQLEFYEKSLKRAQRGLLRKAIWGEPILPQPEKAPSPESSAESPIRRPTRRRGLRLRPKRRAKSTSASSPEREEENEEEEKNDVEQREQEDDIKDEQEDVGDEVEDGVKEEREDNRDEVEPEDTVNKEQDQKEEDQEQRATAADEGDTDCEVCPETQLDPDETQVLIMPTSPKAEPQSQSPSQSPSESRTVLPVQPQSTDQHPQTPEEMDVDVSAPADEEKEQEDMIVASPDGGQDERMEEEAEVFNTSFLKRRGESWTGGTPTKEKRAREDEEEETMATALRGSSSRVPSDPPGPRCSPQSQASSTMACPLCQASFPLDQIEMHAATCYGVEEEEGGGGGGGGHFTLTAADHLQASSPRPKRARNRGLTAEETAAHSSSSVRNRGLTSAEETAAHSSSVGRLFDKKEKCYICHKTVPLSEFGRHTEKCIRQQTSRSEQRGDLLSALEQTESRDATEAGPSGVTYKEVIDLSGHEEEGEGEEEESEVLCVSDSPIRAFTSVSEASDCLVDFKKQLHPRSPTRRAAGRRGGGRRGGGRGGGGGGASRGRGVKRKYKR